MKISRNEFYTMITGSATSCALDKYSIMARDAPLTNGNLEVFCTRDCSVAYGSERIKSLPSQNKFLPNQFWLWRDLIPFFPSNDAGELRVISLRNKDNSTLHDLILFDPDTTEQALEGWLQHLLISHSYNFSRCGSLVYCSKFDFSQCALLWFAHDSSVSFIQCAKVL
jgi:hypothetical protein